MLIEHAHGHCKNELMSAGDDDADEGMGTTGEVRRKAAEELARQQREERERLVEAERRRAEEAERRRRDCERED